MTIINIFITNDHIHANPQPADLPIQAQLPATGRSYCPHLLCSADTCGLEPAPGPREGVRVRGARARRRWVLARILRGKTTGRMKCSKCGALLEQHN